MITRTAPLLMGICSALSAAEDLSAPPITTSKAWAIADGKTGVLIASHQGDEPS